MNVLFMAKETVSSILSLKYMLKKNVNVVFAVVRPQDETLKKICNESKILTGSEADFLAVHDDLPERIVHGFLCPRVGDEQERADGRDFPTREHPAHVVREYDDEHC